MPRPANIDVAPSGGGGGVRRLKCRFEARTRDDCLRCCIEDQSGNPWSDLACADICNQFWDPRRDPERNPADWGGPGADCRGNCWRFATCSPVDPGVQPRINPPGLELNNSGCFTCDDLRAAVKTAGAVEPKSDGECPPLSYKIALMVSPATSRFVCDFHFYRQDPDGTWRDRGGCGPVMGPYSDPELEFRNRQTRARRGSANYTLWCGYLCWPHNVQISSQ